MRPSDYLHRGLAHGSDAVAIASPGSIMTYGQLTVAVDALAAALQSLDATVGSRVGICARNTTEHVIALLATYAAGKVWVPLTASHGRGDLDAMIACTQPSILVADEAYVSRLQTWNAALILTGSDGHTGPSTVRGLVDAWSGKTPHATSRCAEDAQILTFSRSGPSAVNAVAISMLSVVEDAEHLLDFFELNATDANLLATPLSFGPPDLLLPVFAAGGQHVLLERPEPRAIVEQMHAHAISTLCLPTTMLDMLLEERTVRDGPFPSLRHLIYSGAPMPPSRITTAHQLFGAVVAPLPV